MNGDRDECCGVCRFYLPGETEQGMCRRGPPTPFLLQQQSRPSPLEIGGKRVMMAPMQMQVLSQFPPMRADGWCGEFVVREAVYVPDSGAEAAGH